jgi:hypothetical protein
VQTRDQIREFSGVRRSFRDLLIAGGLCLGGGLAGAASPGLVEAGVAVALVGLGLLQCVPMVVRRVRLEPGAIVVERPLWQRVYRYDAVQGVSVYAYGYGRAQKQVYVHLGPRDKRGLGRLSGDAEAIAEIVRAAVQCARGRAAALPATVPMSQRLGRAAMVTLATVAVVCALAALAHASTRIDEARLVTRQVENASTELRRTGKRLDVNVRLADGRLLESTTGAKIDHAAVDRALAQDRATPFRATASADSWDEPWRTGSGSTIVHIYGLERGEESFLSVAESAANRDWVRGALWRMLAMPLLGLVPILFGILRREVSTGSRHS